MSFPSPPTAGLPDNRDELVFSDESHDVAGAGAGPAWRVMIVDDDADVHASTTFALSGLELHGRPLFFLHAYSAREARAMLVRETDLAVILLDVVMEQADAGLHLVRHIRSDLDMTDVRIILRTGQPGYAPEMDAISGYDINDYRTKSELTRTKLCTAITAALRSYEQIRELAMGRNALARVMASSAALLSLHGVAEVSSGVLEQLAQLISQPRAGVLCALQDGVVEVLASVGRGFVAGSAAEMAIRAALDARVSQMTPDSIVLFFPGKSGCDFAAWMPLQRPLDAPYHDVLAVFGAQVTVCLENARLVAHLHDSAFHDKLTGLPNRSRLVELVDATLAGQHRDVSVLALIDIDHFAETNDALGHQFGDLLLVAVSQRLASLLIFGPHSNLRLARVGPDIFGVLGPAKAVNPDLLQQLFDAPYSIDGQHVQLSATIGLVRLSEHDGNSAEALKDADIALKRAKSQQRSGHFYFSRSMGIEIRERVRMMHALRIGFQQGELFLVYQPQVDLVSRRPIGAEALLRWTTADGQSIPPDRFIPIAEYSGLIVQIGEWVLREACAELVRIHAAGYTDFTISVNVSLVQFRHPHFLGMLEAALRESGAPARHVELEITESMAMEDPEQLAALLARVKLTGVCIAVDDFGTGFSSLSHLQRLHVDRLKIDRAFVTEITNSARGSSIAEMVIQLGENLGLSIVAEGVEDERQAQVLQALGCPLAQGYLFSRPLVPQNLMTWLAGDAHRTA
ncbi:MAG: EAL domain-containing protein [Pseudomonadota bacterium]|nr:EAL domain-containing protein [Pseudomonadota bacterium]